MKTIAKKLAAVGLSASAAAVMVSVGPLVSRSRVAWAEQLNCADGLGQMCQHVHQCTQIVNGQCVSWTDTYYYWTLT